MRGKIFAVFATIVVIVGVLSYALARTVLGDPADRGDAPRALAGAMAQLQVDALVLERWLDARASDPRLREPFNAGTPPARADAATNAANGLREAAAGAPELGRTPPSLVVLVDARGVVLGRNGSALMRGENLGDVYPALKDAFARGVTGSDLWVNRQRNEQLLASYAPIRGEDGRVIGGVAVGTALNDERLTDASARTSGRTLIVAVQAGEGLDVVARTRDASPALLAALAAGPARDGALQALQSGRMVDLGGLPEGVSAGARPLDGYGDGRRAVLIGASQVGAPAHGRALGWSIAGATALGLVLAGIAAHLLGNYIAQPIAVMEEGLLQIGNGRSDLRFDIQHQELGGLATQMNALLNQLLGQEEDDTDEHGRPSRVQGAFAFQEALAVDERMAALSGAEAEAEAKALRDEPERAYYARIFREYIAAKRSLGDPVDHITREAFLGRITASERELEEKHGKPVRYRVEVRGKEVVLLAVPLG